MLIYNVLQRRGFSGDINGFKNNYELNRRIRKSKGDKMSSELLKIFDQNRKCIGTSSREEVQVKVFGMKHSIVGL